MCESWYFPKFLLSEGSLTQMYIASLMFLVIPCGSLSTIVKHSGLTGCPVELLQWWIGDGALRYSLSLSPKVLPDSPIYSSRQLMCGHLNLWMTALFCSWLSLFLGVMRRIFIVLVPFKCTWILMVLHVLLNFLPVHGCKVPLWSCSSCCCWLSVEFCPLWMFCLELNLLCWLFRAHGWKLQACKAVLMCSISLWSACWTHYFLL